jgi:hypothetical protein
VKESLPVPRSPMTCHTSSIVALVAGNSKVRRSGRPWRRRGAPSLSTMGAWPPSQVAWRLPLAKLN